MRIKEQVGESTFGTHRHAKCKTRPSSEPHPTFYLREQLVSPKSSTNKKKWTKIEAGDDYSSLNTL